jgi:D-glycero-alpha-D-manno-heptose-7-phosphate kinase
MTITAEAPMRIDFAGGTLDLPPLYLFHHPAPTVNAAINVTAKVTLSPSDDIRIVSIDQNLEASWKNWETIEWETHPMLELVCRLARSFQISPVRIEITSAAPAGSGLGGSSVIAIALTAALSKFTGKNLSESQIIEWAKSIETQSIKVPTGYQDYWGAVYGGLNAYQVELDGSLLKTPLGSDSFRKKLEDHMMLVYVGKPHFSGVNNWELFKQHIDGVNGVPAFFEEMKERGVAMQAAFESENLEDVAAILNDDWQIRKAMLPSMTTPEIEKLTEEAMTAGALALRVCGAGAGGCALLLVSPEKRDSVSKVVSKLGMRDLNAKLQLHGVTVT